MKFTPIFWSILLVLPALAAENTHAHGLWVWKTATVLEAPRSSETLRDFCRSSGVNEVYVSIPRRGDRALETRLVHLIAVLHKSSIRAEALLSSTDADEPGPHREKLLDEVAAILNFNQNHAAASFDGIHPSFDGIHASFDGIHASFDGIHLDIEPQQRPENKGPGNLGFLPGLVDAYRAVRKQAEAARLPVTADIQTKLLKGDVAQRKMLLSSLPRFTLMLYELNSPGDGTSSAEKADKVRTESRKYLAMAYEGMTDRALAKLVIGLRTPDYGDLLPQMLGTVDEANHGNPHYGGWALHSYNDHLSH